jgi:hypothetical protein
MTPRTPYTETEALLLAQEDSEADSGNTDLTDAYLRENFLPGELQRLAWAADLLANRCRVVGRQIEREA